MAAQSTRKQWSLSRGPKGNVQSLVWTECGCPEQQVNLAKQLLEDNNGEDGVDQEEKARLGVYWLTKASEKGNEEATRMLQECIENGIGINEQNLSDVKVCLEMSKGEKLSREAAKELFLSLSQGENYITTHQLNKELLKQSADNSDVEDGNSSNWNILEEGSGEKLTEEMLVSAASSHSSGQLPLVLMNRPLLRSSRFLILMTRVGQATLFPNPFIALVLLSLFGLEAFLTAIPLMLYYGSLIFMVTSSCQVINKKWDYANFQRWSNLLVRYGCHEEISFQAQWSHCLQNCRPCFVFMGALTTHLFLASYIPHSSLSEITVLSTFMSLFLLFHLAWYKKKVDILSILTFIIHLLARYPYDRDTLVSRYWKNLDVHVPAFTSYVLGSGIEFFLNFHVLFYLMLPGLFLGMAVRDRWLGIFKTLLPNLVCLSWWQLAVIASKGSSYFGLIRSCLGLICLIIFVPMVSVTLLLIPLAVFTKLFITETIPTGMAVGGIIITSVLYLGSKLKKWGSLFYYLMVLLSPASLFLNINYEAEKINDYGLEWKEYENICAGNDIQRVEVCLKLSGLRVAWEAKILSSEISSVHNPILPFVQRLPEGLQETVKCLIGEKYPDCEDGGECSISQNLSKKCHISNWNRYEYQFQIELSSKSWTEESTLGLLLGGDRFKNQSISLKKGDRIWFSGYLTSNLENPQQPHIQLENLICLSCPLKVDSSSKLNSETIIPVSLKPVLNFILYPIVITR